MREEPASQPVSRAAVFRCFRGSALVCRALVGARGGASAYVKGVRTVKGFRYLTDGGVYFTEAMLYTRKIKTKAPFSRKGGKKRGNNPAPGSTRAKTPNKRRRLVEVLVLFIVLKVFLSYIFCELFHTCCDSRLSVS